jgi:16S rRNA (guanine1207-N2)-methyltransferase
VAATVAADALDGIRMDGPVLIAADEPFPLETRLDELGLAHRVWRRRTRGTSPACSEPPPGPFGAALLRLPRDKPSLRLHLELSAARLAAGAPLVVYGMNDEGIRSAEPELRSLFERVETRATRRRARVLLARDLAPAAALHGALAAWRETLQIALSDHGGERTVQLVSYPGVFARRGLDEGTAELLRTLPADREPRSVLDFGCGHGVIALAASRLWPRAELTLLDDDAIALEAARANLPGAEILLSDGWARVSRGRRFDLILSNPPFHRGREEDFALIDELLRGAGERLARGGSLMLVVQSTSGVGRLVTSAFRRARRVLASRRFEVWRTL